MADDQASGPLSLARNESIFRNDILPDYLPETMRPAGRPRMILLGGQPGAGKTAVLIASHAELDQSGPTIRIVGDDLRSYHPQFRAFQKQDPETASQFTQADAGRWTERLLRCGAVNAVMTGSGSATYGVFATATAARQSLEQLKADLAKEMHLTAGDAWIAPLCDEGLVSAARPV